MVFKVNNACHGYKGCNAASRNIYASRYHNHGQPAGDYDQESIVIEQVKELLGVQEPAAPDEHGDHVHANKGTDGYSHQQVGVGDRLSWFFP